MKHSKVFDLLIVFFGWLSMGVIFMMSNTRAIALTGFLLVIACIGTGYVTYKVWMDGKLELFEHMEAKGKLTINSNFNPNVALILVHPNMDPGIIGHYIKNDVKGIVLAATALGHVSITNKRFSLYNELELAIRKGIPVIIADSVLFPTPDMDETFEDMEISDMFFYGYDTNHFVAFIVEEIGLVLLAIYLVRRWSKQWNQKFAPSSTESTESV